MEVVKFGRPRMANVTAEEKIFWGFSPRYQGDVTNPRNKSAPVPPGQSTSLYLKGLPGNITVKGLLDALAENGPFGKVQVCSITPPDPARGHTLSASKLVMFARREAEELLSFIKQGNLVIDGHKVDCVWNIHEAPEFKFTRPNQQYMSRVLFITGPAFLVNVERLYTFFASKFRFHTQNVWLVYDNKEQDLRCIRWAFGSLANQAQMAHMALKEPEWDGVRVTFGEDPVALTPGVHPWEESLLHLLPALDNFSIVLPVGYGEDRAQH